MDKNHDKNDNLKRKKICESFKLKLEIWQYTDLTYIFKCMA